MEPLELLISFPLHEIHQEILWAHLQILSIIGSRVCTLT
jgi:hypothetical protein